MGRAAEANIRDFTEPMWAATRAPDMAAAMFKVEIIKLEEAWNDAAIERDAMDIVREDMARLTED